MAAIADETKISPVPRPATIRHRAFSFARVWALATNTLTELVRLKVFYFLLIFALLLIGSSVFLVDFTFQDQFQMLKDASLGAMSVFTSLLAILATASLLPKDIEDRTLYTILAKPVPRFEYLLGKLAGVLLLLLISIVVMGTMFAAILWWRVHIVTGEIISHGGPPEFVQQQLRDLHATAFNPNLWQGAAIIYAESALLASLTLFISTFASSMIFTVIVAMAVYFIGNLEGTAREYWQASNGAGGGSFLGKVFLGPVVLIFPDLQAFNLVDDIVVGTHIAPLLFLKTLSLGVTYLLVYLFAGYFVFSSKEL